MEDARREFEVLAADSFGALPRDFTWATNLGFLALTCAALGDERRAAKLYDLLLPFAPFNLRTSRIGIVCTGPAAHYLGLLAASRQNVDAAVRHFEAALLVGARLGSPPFVAITQVELAHMLLQRGRHDDRERARDVLDEASATAEAIGNRRLAERSAALRRATVGGPLSPREVEVVRLIAAGRSNQEIAEELGISPNTVLHHVTSILGKTAATNRAEAAVYAARHGLLR